MDLLIKDGDVPLFFCIFTRGYTLLATCIVVSETSFEPDWHRCSCHGAGPWSFWNVISKRMWVKQCHSYHPWLGMVNIPSIKIGMTGGWFMKLFHPHVSKHTIPFGDGFLHLFMIICDDEFIAQTSNHISDHHKHIWSVHFQYFHYPIIYDHLWWSFASPNLTLR